MRGTRIALGLCGAAWLFSRPARAGCGGGSGGGVVTPQDQQRGDAVKERVENIWSDPRTRAAVDVAPSGATAVVETRGQGATQLIGNAGAAAPTGLSGAIGRVLGPIISRMEGLLYPDVAVGVQEVVGRTRPGEGYGIYGTQERRNALEQALRDQR